MDKENTLDNLSTTAIIFFILLSIVVSFIAYFPSLSTPFLRDDYHYLLFAKSAVSEPGLLIKPYVGFFRPINTFSWFLLYSIFETKARLYRYAVLFLHGLNTFLVGYICFLLTRNKTFFFISIILFGLNPVHFNTMYWISAFLTSGLATTFILLTTITYFLYLSGSNKYVYIMSIIFYMLAMGTHESSFTLVFIISSCYYMYGSSKKRITLTPYIVITFVIILLLFTVTSFRQAQGIDIASIKHLIKKFHLQNQEIRFQEYKFGLYSFAKFYHSILYVLFSPFAYFYYPASTIGKTLVSIIFIPYLMPLLKSRTLKQSVLGLCFLVIPITLYSGSYFPIIFPRHTYLPNVGQVILVILLLALIKEWLGENRGKLFMISISILLLGYIYQGYYYIQTVDNMPTHKDALKRHEIISSLKKLYEKYNKPYIACVDFPLSQRQFKAISSVFFEDKLVNVSGDKSFPLLMVENYDHITVKYVKGKFMVEEKIKTIK